MLKRDVPVSLGGNMKSLLLLALGAIAVATISHARKPHRKVATLQLAQVATLGPLFDELGRDMEALLAFHEKKPKNDDENLDPKFFHTRREHPPTYLH